MPVIGTLWVLSMAVGDCEDSDLQLGSLSVLLSP